VPIADLAAGLYLAIGILVALHERERTGEGRWVTTSLLESGIAMLDFQATRWTMDGEVPPQEGNHHPTAVPMGCFPTADGSVNIAAWDGRPWTRFCEIVGLGALLEDPRFGDMASRLERRTELNALVSERLATRTTAEWVEALAAADVPVGPVYSIDEVFADPQVRHLDLVQAVPHPTLGDVGIVRNAVSISGHSRDSRASAPEPGEHTRAILAELGIAEREA
jgi:formyl-CoA transferase